MTLVFLGQMFCFYLLFRTKYAILRPLMWCTSCNERRHLRFLFCNAVFCSLVIFIDVFDFFRSTVTQDGLLQSSKALFVVEMLSLVAAIASLVLILKCPLLILSDRAARREIDMWARRERANLAYGMVNNPEERKRHEDAFRERHPRYEDLNIDEVLLEKNEGDATDCAPDKSTIDSYQKYSNNAKVGQKVLD